MTGGSYYLHNTKQGNNYWALIMGTRGAFLSFTVPYNVSSIKIYGASGASATAALNVYANDTLIGTYINCTKDWPIPVLKHQAAGTVYKIQVTNSKNAQITKIECEEAVSGAPVAPVFSLGGGVYTSAQKIAITCETDSAKIYYTTDGTIPTILANQYTDTLTIDSTCTLKAIAIKGLLPSTITEATYKIVSISGQGTKDAPYTVSDVKALENSLGTAEKHWVTGTIVGCYDNNKIVTDTAEAVNSNIALATDGDTIPVELSKGSVRDTINLQDHPENLGATLMVYGTLEAYFSVAGVKNVSDFVLTPLVSALPEVKDEATDEAEKVLIDGQIYILRAGVRYTLTGMAVR